MPAVKLRCQVCSSELQVQKTMADDYKKVFCTGLIPYKNNRAGHRKCTFEGWLKNGVLVASNLKKEIKIEL